MAKKVVTVKVGWRIALMVAFLLPGGSCGKTSFTSSNGVKSGAEAPADPSGDTSSTTDSGTKTNSTVTTGNTTGSSSTTPATSATPAKPSITIDPIKDSDFTMLTGNDMQAALRESRVWVVSRAAATTHVYYFVMRNGALIPTAGQAQKTWSFSNLPNQTGMRTYVTEGGLVFGSTSGYLLWIDPASTPAGTIDTSANNANFFQFPTTSTVSGYVPPGTNDRLCVVSYRRGTKRYLGVGYGYGSFVEMNMAATPPFTPTLQIARAVSGWGASGAANATLNYDASGIGRLWGYSCYINQNKLYYFSQYYQGKPKALDLSTMLPIDPAAAAANGTFAPSDSTITKANWGTKLDGSYALSGDLKGNLFNGQGDAGTGGFYTFTHDPMSNLVFGSTFREPYADSTATATLPGYIYAFPHDCLTTTTNCVFSNTGIRFAYSTAAGLGNVQIGPISSLKIGGFIALTRYDANGQVFYIYPTDNNDITKGLNVTKLADLTGDPYMYTDFTGATLYDITENTVSFDFTKQSTFDATKNVRYVAFNWAAVAGTPTTWSHLSLEARCYSGTDGSAVAYATVDTVKAANLNTYLSAASCRDAKVDHIDLKITQLDNATTASGINTVNVGFFQ